MTKSYVGFQTPTLNEIIQTLNTARTARLDADAFDRRSVLNVLSTAEAGAISQLYGYLDWASNQTNVLYADGANLDLWGLIWGISRAQSTRSTSTVLVTGVNGTVVLPGTRWSSATGTYHTVKYEATVASGTVLLTIESEERGANQNLDIGSRMTLLTPIIGLESTGTVQSSSGGTDLEEDGEPGQAFGYRGRILDRIANPPFGGSAADYITWTKQVPGVTRAWVTSGEGGAGSVYVRFTMDNTYTNGIPLAADIAAVTAYLNEVRPITDQLLVLAPTAQLVPITITNLSPNTQAVKNAIQIELQDMFYYNSSPGGTIYRSKIWEAISVAAGESSHTLTVPSANVTATNAGSLPVLGAITYA